MEESFSESTRSSESEGESSHEDDADDEDASKESLQQSVPTSQESEPPLPNDPTGAEPSKVEAKHGAQEEVKKAGDTGIQDMEVTGSEVASAVGNLLPMSSQDDVLVHTPKDELRSLD